jgi:hypothetical protein
MRSANDNCLNVLVGRRGLYEQGEIRLYINSMTKIIRMIHAATSEVGIPFVAKHFKR